MKKELAQKFLANVLPEKAFWVNNGPILKNLNELAEELKRIDAKTFLHHVNEQKNDFSKWVKDVIGDNILAKQISKVKRKNAMARKVMRRIEALKKALK